LAADPRVPEGRSSLATRTLASPGDLEGKGRWPPGERLGRRVDQLKKIARRPDVGRMDLPPATEPRVGDVDVQSALSRADEAEAKYRSLIALVPAITYAEALDTRRTFSISPQVEATLGYTPEEWLGGPDRWEGCLHPEDRERVVSSCKRANELREPWCEEYRVIAKDGRVIWIHDEAVLVRGSNGQPLCWQGVMVDVTAQRGGTS
jgi:PAS domain S-box-containing protein